MKKNKKKVMIYSIIGIVVLLINFLILLLLPNKKEIKKDNYDGVYISNELSNDPDRVTVTNYNLKKEQCINDICVRNIKIVCYPDKGGIHYQIINKGKKETSGYMKLAFDEFTAIIVFDKLVPGKYTDGFAGYSGYDLRETKDYKLQKMEDSDYSVLVN